MSLRYCAYCGMAGDFGTETCCAPCRAALAVRRPSRRRPLASAPILVSVPPKPREAAPAFSQPPAVAARASRFMSLLRKIGFAK